MRTVIWVVLLVAVGIVTALFVGFDFSNSTGKLDYDDEQSGLKDEITIKFSHVYSESSPQGYAARYFATRLEEKTNYNIEVVLYPNAVLYNEDQELQALQDGNVEMIAPSTSNLTSDFPKFQVLDLPFVFTNHKLINETYHGMIGSHLMKEFNRTSMVGLDFWFSGFKQMTSKDHFVKHPSDFDRMHFGVMDSPMIKRQFNTLGASTSVLNFNKLYRNLDVGFIDGQENTVSNIYTRKFYQVQDHLTVSNHAMMSQVVLINRKFWEDLTPELRSEINNAMNETSAWVSRHSIEINDQQIRQLKRDESIQIHILTKNERKAWQESLQSLLRNLEPTIGKKLMDEINRIYNQ